MPDEILLRAHIDRRVLAALLPFCSTVETRFCLGGVYIEARARRTIYAALDGHAMLVASTEVPEGEPDNIGVGNMLVPPALCAYKSTSRRRLDHVAVISKVRPPSEGAAAQLWLSADGTQQSAAEIDGSFPDWRRLLPIGAADPGSVAAQAAAAEAGGVWLDVPLRYRQAFAKFAKALDLPSPKYRFPPLASTERGPIAALVLFGSADTRAYRVPGEVDAFGVATVINAGTAGAMWQRPDWL